MLRADAIVVLGCRVTASGAPSAAGARRVAAAAAAYREGVAPVVITSGGRRWGAHVEACALRHELVRRGVPREAIAVELCSFSTYENAVFSAELLQRIRARRVAIVTCAWHMDRALANFRTVGVEAHAVPAPDPDTSLVTRTRRRVGELLSATFDARALRRVAVYRRAALEVMREADLS